MNSLFSSQKYINPDVSNWDVSKIKVFGLMFMGAVNADPDVSKWKNDDIENTMQIFNNSGAVELDLRGYKFKPNSDDYSVSYMFSKTKKLQYIYLGPTFPSERSSQNKEIMSGDFKKQVDGEKSSEIITGSHNEYKFTSQANKNILYFIPQKVKIITEWLDEDMPEKTRPSEREVELLVNGQSINPKGTVTMPEESNKIKLNNTNSWSGKFTNLDIFTDGSMIIYGIRQDSIDDYLTDIKETKNVVRNQVKKITNTYKKIIEEKEIGKKPRTPHNFVKVTVDTTDKATDETKFKRVFWVSPNREIEIPVDEPVGKTTSEKNYNFEKWKEKGEKGDSWQKGNKIKKVSTKNTEIEAIYSEDDVKVNERNHTSLLIPIERHFAYIFGYPDSSLKPEGKEAAALVLRLAEIETIDDSSGFQDTVKGAWYNRYVNKCFEKNMLLAYENKIRPNEKITRAEFAKLISNLDDKNYKDLPFEDTKGHKFEKEIAQAYANNRIAGYPDKSFRPDGEITRSEAVKILNSLFERSADESYIDKNQDELKKFTDLSKNHWAYYDLVEASNSYEYVREGSKEVWKRIINK